MQNTRALSEKEQEQYAYCIVKLFSLQWTHDSWSDVTYLTDVVSSSPSFWPHRFWSWHGVRFCNEVRWLLCISPDNFWAENVITFKPPKNIPESRHRLQSARLLPLSIQPCSLNLVSIQPLRDSYKMKIWCNHDLIQSHLGSCFPFSHPFPSYTKPYTVPWTTWVLPPCLHKSLPLLLFLRPILPDKLLILAHFPCGSPMPPQTGLSVSCSGLPQHLPQSSNITYSFGGIAFSHMISLARLWAPQGQRMHLHCGSLWTWHNTRHGNHSVNVCWMCK